MKRLVMSTCLLFSMSGCGAQAPDDVRPGEDIGAEGQAWSLAGSGQCPAGQPSATGCWSQPSASQQPGAFTSNFGTLLLPICRAYWVNGWHPGKIWNTQCLFEYGGTGVTAGNDVPGRNANVRTFETLINDGHYFWVNNTGPNFSFLAPPNDAISGGPTSGGVDIAVCSVRVADDQRYHAGKYWYSNGKWGCNVEYAGSYRREDAGDVYVLVHR